MPAPLPPLPPPRYASGVPHGDAAVRHEAWARGGSVAAPAPEGPALLDMDLLRPDEIARALRHARPHSDAAASYVRRLHERQGLPYVKVGRQRLTRRADFAAWLAKGAGSAVAGTEAPVRP